ncbi:MAG: AMP-binding protein [Eubacteriales bacterium]|nr:AMP-binding protein [Eubacteriales bacterium]
MELYEKYIKEELNSDGTLRAISFDAPKNFNFAYDVVDEFAKTEPSRKAMIWVADDGSDRIFTFKDISLLSNQVANFFTDMGVKRGDRVMLILRRHYEFWLAIVALHKIGAIAIPATDQLKKKDVVYRIEKAGVTTIVCTADGTISGEVEKAASEKSVKNLIIAGNKDGWTSFSKAYEYPTEFERRETDIDDIMLMYFTSGTTSYPKMAAHTYSYALAHFVTAKWWHCVKKDGIHFTVAETGWGKAVWGKLYGQWLCGACVFTFDFSKFDQDRVLRMIEKYKITTFCAPPTIYRFLIKADLSHYDLSSLVYATTAGEAVNPEVVTRFKEATGLTLMEGFGQTETTLTVANLKGMTPKLGSMGKPTPQYKLGLLNSDGTMTPNGEVGEICIDISEGRPFGLFKEYYLSPDITAEAMHDGYYHTGDMAWRDEDGYLYYVGRTDDLIKSSGYRIGPFEIESVLMEHPSVLECAVTGAPDPVRGQVVKATIVLAKGFVASDELKKEIQTYVKNATAPYKYPRIIDFVEELPKTISGKIKRTELRKQ